MTSLNELRKELSLITAKYTEEKTKHEEINKELELQRQNNLILKEKINTLINSLGDDTELLVNSKHSMKLAELAYRISNVDSTILGLYIILCQLSLFNLKLYYLVPANLGTDFATYQNSNF